MNTDIDKKIENILLPSFGASVMLTLMSGKCTDGVIKIRDEAIEETKKLFSSFHSLDIDSLQRYDGIMAGSGIKSDKGVFIRYDDLKKLLQDTLELNQ